LPDHAAGERDRLPFRIPRCDRLGYLMECLATRVSKLPLPRHSSNLLQPVDEPVAKTMEEPHNPEIT
jgi:hypothetical protein